LAPSRVNCGVEMLLDRACPGGGWNAGNGLVYGSAVAPHPDDTAITLLALRDRPQERFVKTSIDYLEHTAPSLTAPWSLAWAVLALAAHRRPITSLHNVLNAFPDLIQVEDTNTLALVCLALGHEQALAKLGVGV
jgi:hypothetical protein